MSILDPTISIVIPVHNEAEVLPEFLDKKLYKRATAAKSFFEIVIVLSLLPLISLSLEIFILNHSTFSQ